MQNRIHWNWRGPLGFIVLGLLLALAVGCTSQSDDVAVGDVCPDCGFVHDNAEITFAIITLQEFDEASAAGLSCIFIMESLRVYALLHRSFPDSNVLSYDDLIPTEWTFDYHPTISDSVAVITHCEVWVTPPFGEHFLIMHLDLDLAQDVIAMNITM